MLLSSSRLVQKRRDTQTPHIVKIKVRCGRCGLYLGDYWGENCYLMPATSETKPLCETCSRLFRRQGKGRVPNRYRQISIKAFDEEENPDDAA